MKPVLKTFVSTPEDLEIALQSGADHLILEDSKLSLRCLNNDFHIPHFEKIALLARAARKQNPSISLSVNCDILIHHRHFPLIDALIDVLKKAKITQIRVQDPGLLSYFLERYPEANLHLCTETGNLNTVSLLYYASLFQSQTLNHELPYTDIQEIQAYFKDHQKWPYDFDCQVHGPILLQYSNRRYMASRLSQSGQFPADPNHPEMLQKSARDHDHPDRRFVFLDTPHGHFMFAHFDRCLLTQLPKLMSLNLQGWIIDCRGYTPDLFKTTLESYRVLRDLLTSNPTKVPDKTQYDALKALSPRPLLPGFFLSNKTDYELRKNIRMEEKYELSDLKGIIVDYAKGKWCTVEVKTPFSAEDTLQVLTQENKLTPLEPLQLADLENNPLTKAPLHSLVKVKWQKGMQPKALLY